MTSNSSCHAQNQDIIQAPTTDDRTTFSQPKTSDRPNRSADRFQLSLSSAFEVASNKHPDIVVALKNLDIARANVITAGARPNPQFAAQLGFGPAYTGVIAGNTQQIGINQLVEMGGKRSARLKYAKDLYDLTSKQLADLRYDVRSQVRRAYAEAAAAEASVLLIEDQRDVIEKFFEIAEYRVQAKIAALGEEQQVKLALDRFHADENEAYANLRRACIKLDYLLGMPLEQDIDVENNGLFQLAAAKTELVPAPDAPLPTLKELVDSAYEHRPDWAVAKQQNAANKSALSLHKRQAIPDVLLGSGFAYSTYKQTPVQVPQQYGAYLNVNVDVPIFYRHQGEIAAAKSAYEQSQRSIDTTRLSIKRDVYLAYESLSSTRHNILLYQTHLLPDAKEVARVARQRYESKDTDIGDAVVGQRQYLDTMQAYFNTVVAYQNAWADLETAIGSPLRF